MGIDEILKISFEISRKYPSPGSKIYIGALLNQRCYKEDFKSKEAPIFNLQDFINDVFGSLEDSNELEISNILDDNFTSCNDTINKYETRIYKYIIDKCADIPYKGEERKKYIDELLKSKELLIRLKNSEKEISINNLLLKNNKTEIESIMPIDSLNKEITLSFTLPLGKLERFMLDFSKFCIQNKIPCYFTSKIVITNEMFKIRLYDFDYIDKITNFIDKYKVEYSENPFVNKYNNVGIVIGNMEKYINFLEQQIYNYVKSKKVIEQIDKEEFISNLKDYISNIDINSEEYIYFINLNNILNKEEFDIDVFKNEVKKLEERLKIKRI